MFVYAQRKPPLLISLSCSIAHALVTESVADSVDSSGLTYKHKMSFQKIITQTYLENFSFHPTGVAAIMKNVGYRSLCRFRWWPPKFFFAYLRPCVTYCEGFMSKKWLFYGTLCQGQDYILKLWLYVRSYTYNGHVCVSKGSLSLLSVYPPLWRDRCRVAGCTTLTITVSGIESHHHDHTVWRLSTSAESISSSAWWTPRFFWHHHLHWLVRWLSQTVTTWNWT